MLCGKTGRTLAELLLCVLTLMLLMHVGGVTPRRITSVGYCTGGSVASLAAVFAALQCPTADVRCITFGSQLVGNAAFANAFRWVCCITSGPC